jgi:hypothetical protein
VETSSPKN